MKTSQWSVLAVVLVVLAVVTFGRFGDLTMKQEKVPLPDIVDEPVGAGPPHDYAEPPAAAKPPPKMAKPKNGGGGHKNGAPAAANGGGGDDEDYAVVRVLYATDRNHIADAQPAEAFGGARAALSYGYCDVSIPREHRLGELEEPSIWRLEFREDPEKHVVLLSAEVLPKDDFFRDLADRVAESAGGNAFLFVHGYNVAFAEAARRTAQISYDLAFDGAPVFYSWPSQGKTQAYTVDEQNIEWSQANLRGFLEDFFTRSQAQNGYLIAHSMGNRALARAAAALMTDKPELRARLKEVILTAPDIDAAVFKRDIAPMLAAAGRPVTLYASSQDLALLASKRVHGYPRAGDAGPGLVVVPGIETIDATQVDTSLLGHSYFAEASSVLSDIFYLIRSGERADRRFGLRRVEGEAGAYWEFKR